MKRLAVARAVAWRTLHNVFTNPSLFIPSIVFPLFFFTAFAGGLSRVSDVPGFRFPQGYTGFQFVFVLLAFALLVTLGFGALGAFAALKTGSGEAVQGLFPVFFVFLFISSMNIPRDLISATWFRDLATANPVSYLIECVRSLIITGWDGQALALGFGIAAAITVVSLALASRALKVRMAR